MIASVLRLTRWEWFKLRKRWMPWILLGIAVARERLHLDTLPNQQRERITLLHGSLIYRDKRLSGYDAAIAMEVIEHMDTSRLDAFEEVVFGAAKPDAVLITTPNAEYALFPHTRLSEQTMRMTCTP